MQIVKNIDTSIKTVKSMTTTLLSNLIETGTNGMYVNPNVITSELIALSHVPINREFKRRINKMAKHFKKGLKGQNIFVVFRVTENLEFNYHGETISVEPGLYIADGNTRFESMRTGKIDTPDSVTAFVFDILNEEEFMDEYFAIDNQAATENSTDKIRGAIQFFGMNMNSTKGKGGSFASALNFSYPGDPKDSVLEKVAFFKSELELLDECGIFNPTEKDIGKQHIFGACLMAAKLYGQPPASSLKLKGVLQQLSRLDFDSLITQKDKWNGVTAMIYQTCEPHRKKWVPEEYMGSTKFASVEPCYDFYLYCLEMAMTDKLLDKTKGFKPSNWKGYYEETLDQIKND